MNTDIPPWANTLNLPKSAEGINLFRQASKLETLERAWLKVRANRGCAGSDG